MDSKTKSTLSGLAAAFGIFAALNNPFWQDQESATQVIQDAGHSAVSVGGYGWFDCGSGDLWHTKFTARNPNNREVKGVVCEGVFKGATIRYERG